jgi:RecB family exonuclease
VRSGCAYMPARPYEAACMNTSEGWRPAEVLSPSQVTQFLQCPAKWYFRYLLDLEEPTTAATALGRAFHESIAYNFRQKIQTSSDLAVGDCLEYFRSSLGRHLENVALQRGIQPIELMDLGTVMLEKYLCEAAPLIRPAAVETPVAGSIGGVKVRGYVDLVDKERRIIDTKSALKPAKGISHDHRLQLTSYAMITPETSGLCRLDTVTKGRTVRLSQTSFQVGAADRRYAETIYPMVQESISEGIFLPRRSSGLCSRKYCEYWRSCEREFGGVVRDE